MVEFGHAMVTGVSVIMLFDHSTIGSVVKRVIIRNKVDEKLLIKNMLNNKNRSWERSPLRPCDERCRNRAQLARARFCVRRGLVSCDDRINCSVGAHEKLHIYDRIVWQQKV